MPMRPGSESRVASVESSDRVISTPRNVSCPCEEITLVRDPASSKRPPITVTSASSSSQSWFCSEMPPRNTGFRPTDSAASFSMLVAVAACWKWYGARGREPDELGKMIIGSLFSMAGGACLCIAAATQGAGKIGLFWPLMFHLLNSIAFSHILPVSLALFSRLAPKAINATVLGIYYLAFFAANKIVGTVGGWYSTMPTTQFWALHIAAAGMGLVAFVLFKLVLARRLLGDEEAQDARV